MRVASSLFLPHRITLDRLEAYTEVNVRLDRRVATGDRLTYHADDERYVMTGIATVPVRIIEECRETTRQNLTFFKSADRIIVDGNEEVRTQSSRSGPCPQPTARLMSTLRTHELTKSYGGRTVVRGVSLEVASGEVVGLLGPNGAGKTTTFYMTVGLTAPDSGRVVLDGDDVTDDPMYVRARKGIGLPAAGAIDLPRSFGRTEHSRDSGDARASIVRRAASGCRNCSES